MTDDTAWGEAPAVTDSQSQTPFSGAVEPAENTAKLRGKLYAFRNIGGPLLAAVTELRSLLPSEPHERTPERDATALAQLVQSAVALAEAAGRQLGAEALSQDDWIRWSIAATASGVVAAHYRVTGRPLPVEDASVIINAIEQAGPLLADLPPPPDGEEVDPNSPAYLRLKMLAAMGPVIGAISRYSFGRPEQQLVSEVARAGCGQMSVEVTRSLVTADNHDPEEWRLMCGAVLEVAGQLYAESHFAEADRLLDMSPDERNDYLTRHNNSIPMDPVWNSFILNMAMLTTVAGFLDIPQGADLSGPKKS